MAARSPRNPKNEESILGLPHDSDDRLSVQKSTPLYGLWRSELSLADFKILDTYLSRINSHDPEHRTVHLEKGEIERLLGIKKINVAELKKRLAHLGTMVPVDDPINDKAFRMISLFEQIICEPDEDGVWQVDITCTAAAKKYIFNIENLGYFRYKLRAVTHIRSRYSYILFLYLEKNRHMHSTWEISLDDLKRLLKCEQEETYRQYKRFNDRLLKRCHKELTENTDCQFTYEPVKHGRAVRAIRFTLAPALQQFDAQLSFDMPEYAPAPTDGTDDNHDAELLDFLAGACNYEFSYEGMRVLLDLILQLIPHDQNGLERFNYLRQKYNLLQMYSTKKNITNRFSYIRTIIEKDIG